MAFQELCIAAKHEQKRQTLREVLGRGRSAQLIVLFHQSKTRWKFPTDLDHLALLYPSDLDGLVSAVRVNDQCSKSQYVNITIQGVSTSGIIDTGADIMIIGGELFKKIIDVVQLKKKDFKKPDHIPHTCDHMEFKLHGRMDLEIGFDDKVVKTPIYFKMDAHDQLLLSEGVCRERVS